MWRLSFKIVLGGEWICGLFDPFPSSGYDDVREECVDVEGILTGGDSEVREICCRAMSKGLWTVDRMDRALINLVAKGCEILKMISTD